MRLLQARKLPKEGDSVLIALGQRHVPAVLCVYEADEKGRPHGRCRRLLSASALQVG